MMNAMIAIYARVAVEQPVAAHTLASQVAALRARVTHDGRVLMPEMEFIDNGFSGATLVRPALVGLRAVVAAGALERLYIHSPDRLTRQCADWVQLVDEFQHRGVAVIFLNGELGCSPEVDRLGHVPGTMAE